MKIIERLATYIDYKHISFNSFDKSIGTANGYIGKQIKNGASIGSDIIETIISVYDDLSLIWLITGSGEMLKSGNGLEQTADQVAEPPGYYDKKIIEAQVETIETLKKYIKLLESELEKVKSQEQKEKPGEAGQKRKAG